MLLTPRVSMIRQSLNCTLSVRSFLDGLSAVRCITMGDHQCAVLGTSPTSSKMISAILRSAFFIPILCPLCTNISLVSCHNRSLMLKVDATSAFLGQSPVLIESRNISTKYVCILLQIPRSVFCDLFEGKTLFLSSTSFFTICVSPQLADSESTT